MDLTPRAVIAGRYRVDTRVGAGGMGEVWLGEHIAVGVRVAVKTLLPAAAMNHEVVARFKREAYILGRIRSDHVARVVDFVADDVYGLVLVMEFVDGDALSRVLAERTLTVEEGVDLAIGLASALKDLHGASIIHRDLKPGNVMMQPMPDGRRRAVVVDFGVSRLMADKDKDEDEEITGITRADMAVGTIEYMAPEQILNSRNVTPGSDIYAAGAMLFRACAGRHVYGPVSSDTELAQKKLTTEAPALPLNRSDPLAEGFAKVVARMVKRRPSERYKTADDVLTDLMPLKSRPKSVETDTSTAVKPVVASSTPSPAPAPLPAQAAEPAPLPAPSGSTPSRPVVAALPQESSSPSRDNLVPAAVPSRRGVPLLVTFALVAAALGGGLFLGPRLMAPGGFQLGPSEPSASAPSGAQTPPPAASSGGAAVPVSASAASDGDAGAKSSAAAGAGSATDAGAVDAGVMDAGALDAGLAARFRDGGVGYPRAAFDGGIYTPPPKVIDF